FVPRQLFGRQLVDGGVRDMVPTRLLRSMGAEVVAAVDLGAAVDNRQEATNFPAVIMRALALLEREATRQQLPTTADVLIAPVLPPFTSLDKKQIEEHIRLGADAARAQLPVLRRLLS
ncbi:MAG TPA: patatin family protein, partial [Firmicutes bacterium]|nr:patatin family protein [Bacillota bacterium]